VRQNSVLIARSLWQQHFCVECGESFTGRGIDSAPTVSFMRCNRCSGNWHELLGW